MAVVMIVAFMVGWTPYAAFSILVTASPSIHLDPRMASIPAFLSKTAAVYNPIIYVFMNKQVTGSQINNLHFCCELTLDVDDCDLKKIYGTGFDNLLRGQCVRLTGHSIK